MSEEFFYYIKILGVPFAGLFSTYGVYKITGDNTGVGKIHAFFVIISILLSSILQTVCYLNLGECDIGYAFTFGIAFQLLLVLLWFFGFLCCLELFWVKFLRIDKL